MSSYSRQFGLALLWFAIVGGVILWRLPYGELIKIAVEVLAERQGWKVDIDKCEIKGGSVLVEHGLLQGRIASGDVTLDIERLDVYPDWLGWVAQRRAVAFNGRLRGGFVFSGHYGKTGPHDLALSWSGALPAVMQKGMAGFFPVQARRGMARLHFDEKTSSGSQLMVTQNRKGAWPIETHLAPYQLSAGNRVTGEIWLWE